MLDQIDPNRLDLDRYPFQWTIDSTFGDMDIAGHINNIALARYYETGRSRWLLNITDDPTIFKRGFNTVIAEYTIRFLKEVNFPDQVIVANAVGRIGNSSFSCQQALFVDGSCVGLCDAAMVLSINGKPTPIAGNLREKMQSHLINAS